MSKVIRDNLWLVRRKLFFCRKTLNKIFDKEEDQRINIKFALICKGLLGDKIWEKLKLKIILYM